MYKYNCRKCPIRSRCIDASGTSPSVKVTIRRAFEARTDTLATWGVLQKSCLLVLAEKERSTSALSDRLRKTREAKKQTAELKSEKAVQPKKQTAELKSEKAAQPKKPVIRRLRPLSKPAGQESGARSEKPVRHPDYLQPVSSPKEKRPIRPLKRLTPTQQLAQGGPGFFWLTIEDTGRHIALPVTGELVLGRFDPNVGIPPDIDLIYEDQGANLISRRHATIIGKDGTHSIEDLGSRPGTLLNGVQVQTGSSQVLKPGDHIKLGNIQFLYDKIPLSILKAAKTKQVRHILLVTPTGRKLTVTPQGDLIIGRADVHMSFVPDVDLSRDGDAARRVSRRHALIQWKRGRPYVEDLGSGFGTRLGSEVLSLGASVPLKPGDHIWLAGCVLAYDIEM